MNAGSLDRRIIVQVKTETQSRSGAVTETWANSLNIAAAFEPLGSREFPLNQKRYSETTARFRIRYRTGITPDRHRISYNGQIWNIRPPLMIGRKVALEIEASEIQ